MGKDNGIFTYELQGPFERALVNLYIISVSEGMNGIQFEYSIICDYAKKLKWDSLETLMVIRSIAAQVKKK